MLVLAGKTCSGKTVIRDELVKLGLKSVVSYTTRPMRKGEIAGITYHYIEKEDFLKKIDEGFFFEYTSYNVADGDTWYYGTALEDLTDDSVAIFNPDGLRALAKNEVVNPVVFYVSVSEKVLRERLLARGDDPKEAKRRLDADKRDFQNVEYDCAISNNSNLFTPMELAKIIWDEYRKRRNKQ